LSVDNKFRNPNDETLTVRDHLDPDKHWIGETLPAPTIGDVQYAGVLTSAGASPFPSRADHSHDLRTRQTFLNASNKSCPGPSSTYIDNFVTSGGWEDFLHTGSGRIIDFPIEGTYIINNRVTITRSSGVFPATLAYIIQFNYTNAASIHELETGNLPEGRGRYTTPITEIVSYGSITGTQNLQFLYQNFDTVAHLVTMRTIIQRSASSIGAESE
jgi:hypothetical protein